jgi:tetratricopeptide (TPR) repeat protein
MKIRAILFVGALSVATWLPAAEKDLTEQFQQALFEEEANRNLPAAIEGYEAVIRRLDEQRQLAATAVFRMGESYRKLGKTNDAVRAYERILSEFQDQETLVKLSEQNLSVLAPKKSATDDEPQLDERFLKRY